MNKKLKVAIVAGEKSGDNLGSDLINQLSKNDIEFFGIGGSNMTKHKNFTGFFSIDDITALGISQILKIYFKARKILFVVLDIFVKKKVDVFIGIDAPMFNLPLAKNLKLANKNQVNICYVSPTIWVFAYKRIFKIMKSYDGVLCLYPFEVEMYKKHNFPAFYVGHPVLQQKFTSKEESRKELGISSKAKVIGCFAGSRSSEIKLHLPIFSQVIKKFNESGEKVIFIFNVGNNKYKELFEKYEDIFQNTNCKLFFNKNIQCMSASDVVLAKSGTTALECMFAKRAMSVFYKISKLNYLFYKLLPIKKITRISMPNWLANKDIVPEFIQDKATAQNLYDSTQNLLNNKVARDNQLQKFDQIIEQMQKNKTPIDRAFFEIYNLKANKHKNK